jgi:hypothetical protein
MGSTSLYRVRSGPTATPCRAPICASSLLARWLSQSLGAQHSGWRRAPDTIEAMLHPRDRGSSRVIVLAPLYRHLTPLEQFTVQVRSDVDRRQPLRLTPQHSLVKHAPIKDLSRGLQYGRTTSDRDFQQPTPVEKRRPLNALVCAGSTAVNMLDGMVVAPFVVAQRGPGRNDLWVLIGAWGGSLIVLDLGAAGAVRSLAHCAILAISKCISRMAVRVRTTLTCSGLVQHC